MSQEYIEGKPQCQGEPLKPLGECSALEREERYRKMARIETDYGELVSPITAALFTIAAELALLNGDNGRITIGEVLARRYGSEDEDDIPF